VDLQVVIDQVEVDTKDIRIARSRPVEQTHLVGTLATVRHSSSSASFCLKNHFSRSS
jgi:hypothetical protein